MSKQITLTEEAFDALNEYSEIGELPSQTILRLVNRPDPSNAIIQFILENEFELDEPMTFLKLWNEGEFDKLREEWSELDLPDEIFIGADTQFVPKD